MVTMTATPTLPLDATHEPAASAVACGKYVFCAGMPRSGSTWQYQIVSHLLEEQRGGLRGGFLERVEDFERIEEQLAGRIPWLTLKAHNGFPPYAKALQEARALAVYSYRDVRDVTFSLMHKMGKSFHDIVTGTLMLPQCLADHTFWTAQPHVLAQRYEDIVADPVGGVRQIAAFLQTPLTDAAAERLAEMYSLEANRARTQRLARDLRDKGVDLDDPKNAVLHDEHSQLHWNHIRQGRIGGWRDEATPEQVVELAGICAAWLIENGYERDGSWALPGVNHLVETLHATRTELHEERRRLWVANEELQSLKEFGPTTMALAVKLHRASKWFPRLRGALKGLLQRIGVIQRHTDAAPPV